MCFYDHGGKMIFYRKLTTPYKKASPKSKPKTVNNYTQEKTPNKWKNDQPEKSSALIGAEGRIFLITKNFAVIEQPEVAAIGIHHGFALGYVTAIKGCWPPQEILNKAMHALIRNSQGCIGPVVEKMI